MVRERVGKRKRLTEGGGMRTQLVTLFKGTFCKNLALLQFLFYYDMVQSSLLAARHCAPPAASLSLCKASANAVLFKEFIRHNPPPVGICSGGGSTSPSVVMDRGRLALSFSSGGRPIFKPVRSLAGSVFSFSGEGAAFGVRAVLITIRSPFLGLPRSTTLALAQLFCIRRMVS